AHVVDVLRGVHLVEDARRQGFGDHDVAAAGRDRQVDACEARYLGGPGPCRVDDRIGVEVPGGGADPADPTAAVEHAGDFAAAEDLGAAGPSHRQQVRDDQHRHHLRVVGVEGCADGVVPEM